VRRPVPSGVPQRTTARLVLRGFRDADRDAFAAMNADARVMEYLPAVLTRVQSDAFVDRISASWAERGLGLWALEHRGTGTLLGYTGLWPVPASLPIESGGDAAVEVGWRLAFEAWGQGYATEAARAALRFGFDEIELTEVVSFTSVHNLRSQALMRRLGMTRDPAEDFEHPDLPAGHRLRPHVLYRVRRHTDDAGSAAQTTPTSRKPTRS
jgi:RimJ/RimL family protein N-acetyltransferase